MRRLDRSSQALLWYVLPALLSGGLTWCVYLFLADTPLVRASGLALVVAGLTLALRHWNGSLALIGGLTLAFSPAFWSQTGGGQGDPATIVIAMGAAAGGFALMMLISRRPDVAFGLGVIVFTLFFFSQIGTERSLRLTSFISAWLLFLLVDMLRTTNPRPEDQPPEASQPEPPRPYHTLGMLLLFTVGTLNDPLVVLFAPALALSLALTYVRLPAWYWLILLVVSVAGLRALALTYVNAPVPLVNLADWRDARRWVALLALIVQQFSLFGLVLGVMGLARMARWYPPLGTVTMIAYAPFFFFGLVYEGFGREVLLLPLLFIQVIWMTYAVYALGEWASKAVTRRGRLTWRLVQAGYAVLPLTAFLTQSL